MAEVDDFIDSFLPTLVEAETALRNGNPDARPAIWSRNNPVTFFGAAFTGRSWKEIAPAFKYLASQFSDCSPSTTR